MNKQPTEYTVMQLKEILRRCNLSVSGTKAEMITRLESFNPEIWKEIDMSHIENIHDDETVETVRASIDERERALLNKENELLKLENDLLKREQMVRRNNETNHTENLSEESSNRTPKVNMRTIAELLSEFHGDTDTFNMWKNQLLLLKSKYNLDEDSVRILICSRIKGRAATWFHSAEEHLSVLTTELLGKMQMRYGNRLSKLELRRKLEKRLWNKNESFVEYYHEKVMLAKKAQISEDEIVELIVDGIKNFNLRNQARVNKYKKKEDLLEAFQDALLSPVSEQENNYQQKDGKQNQYASSKGIIRCYNCNGVGHIASACTKEKRERGSCFNCGAMDHRKADYSVRKQEEFTVSTPKNATQVANIIPPYTVKLSYVINETDNCCKYVLTAMLDSGSSISLINEKFVPIEARIEIKDNKCKFFGLNNSELKTKYIFKAKIDVEGIETELTFYIVPENTMVMAAILGRDFVSIPRIKGNLGIFYKNESIDNEKFIEEIMNIDYIEVPTRTNENLQINDKLNENIIKQIHKLYENEYLNNYKNEKIDNNFEMNMKLKNDELIQFRSRHLSFVDKEKLQVILDDLLKKQIIRPSESPYASPIVLVRKKAEILDCA